MIFKYVITSFAVTLTSALEALRGHELVVFITLYAMHLMVCSMLVKRPLTRQAALSRPPSAQMQHWARGQHAALNENSLNSF